MENSRFGNFMQVKLRCLYEAVTAMFPMLASGKTNVVKLQLIPKEHKILSLLYDDISATDLDFIQILKMSK